MSERGTKGENVFQNRNFRLVFFGALVSELGATLYSLAVSFYILEISGSNAFLQGLYLAICGAVLLLFTPVGGVLGDRCDKGKIMFVCDCLILLSDKTLPFASAENVPYRVVVLGTTVGVRPPPTCLAQFLLAARLNRFIRE